jgi:glycosyltransferase involved in cell wall biosynthesis
VLRSVEGLVTVSEPWQTLLARKYTVPVEVVYNGFEPRTTPAEPPAAHGKEPLHVAHLGTLYGGKRDPTPLFEALRILGADARQVRVHFYGPDQERIHGLAAVAGVANSVEVHGELPYADSLAVQSRSDVLLLLMWDRPEEAGVIPAKLFEYFGARRPVLAVGARDGAAADLIRSRDLGLASSDPSEIAARLRDWIAEKQAASAPLSLPVEAVAEFSRSRQVARLSDYLAATVARRGTPTGGTGH